MIWISFFSNTNGIPIKEPSIFLVHFWDCQSARSLETKSKTKTLGLLGQLNTSMTAELSRFGFDFQDMPKISPILFEMILRTQMVDSYTSKGILQNASYLNKRSPTRASFPTISYIVGYVDHENIARLYR